jgi:ParB family chromosome partitioning protein
VPVVVRRTTDKEALELALVENIQRQDLNCVDEALAYQQLMEEFHLSQEEVGTRVGKDRATVANCLRVLRLPAEILQDLKSGVLSLGHAKAILMIESAPAQITLRNKIVAEKLSVRQAESAAQAIKGGAAAAAGPTSSSATAGDPVQSRFLTLSQNLTKLWSARVEIKGSRRKGKVIFQYDTPEQLERMLAAMQNPQTWPATPASQ